MTDDITLDFECFYGTKYSLRSLSYTDYIADPRFCYTGLTVKINDGPTEFIEPGDISRYLQGLTWGRGERLICHNMLFDGLVLRLQEGIEPSHLFCTQAAARALMPGVSHSLGNLVDLLGIGHKNKQALTSMFNKTLDDVGDAERDAFIRYNVDDTNQAYELFRLFHDRLTSSQRHQMDYTLRMCVHPRLQLDRDRAQAALDAQRQHRKQLVKASGYSEKALASRPQFADILREHHIEPPTKLNDKGEETWAFAKDDLDFIDLYRHEHIQHLLDAKAAVSSNIDIKRPERMIDMHDQWGVLPACYKWYGAHTGRVSGDNKVNFANFRRGGEMRKSIVAPPGHVLVVVDSSQIEARKNAENAGQNDLLDVFRRGDDPYNDFASRLYNRPVNRKAKRVDDASNYLDANGTITDKDNAAQPDFIPGFVGKTCILGLGYGMGWRKFQNQMAIGMMGGPRLFYSDREAREVVATYRSQMNEVVAFWSVAERMLHAMINGRTLEWNGLRTEGKAIRLPSGRYLQYPALRATEDGFVFGLDERNPTKIYGGLLTENIIQATSHDIVAWQGECIDQHYKLVMQTYDELVACVPEDQADECLAFMESTMRTPPPYDPNVPLDVEGGYAREYSK